MSGIIHSVLTQGERTPYSKKAVFTVNTSWVVPYDVPSGKVRIKCWGAGAGGNTASSVFGGAGGFSQCDYVIAPGSLILVAVGQSNMGAAGGVNGGGAGSTYGRGGGGYSGVYLNGVTSLINMIIIAGGGGGGGYLISAYGGAGGGNVGQNGTGPNSSYFGYGGSQSAGGYGNPTYGQSGSLFVGGNATNVYTGGGGGGYYGGGAGVYAGGGGSGFIISSATNKIISTGNYTVPPNTGDIDYAAGIGVGTNQYSGGTGRVVIYY